jgi:hypothetical protein
LTNPMSLNRRHDMLHDIPVLLLQGSNRGEDSFRKLGAVAALVAEASLPPQDCPAQSSYRHPQPPPVSLFLPTRFIQMRRLGLGYRRFSFLVGDGQSPGGLFTHRLYASQSELHPAQLSQQFNYLPASLAETARMEGHLGLQPKSKGASGNLGRQLRLYPGLTMGTPAGQQPGFGNDRVNLRQSQAWCRSTKRDCLACSSGRRFSQISGAIGLVSTRPKTSLLSNFFQNFQNFFGTCVLSLKRELNG